MLREFGRRLIADNLNANATYEAYYVEHGSPPPPGISLRRPRCKTLGRGAGQQLTFADGSAGPWNALDVRSVGVHYTWSDLRRPFICPRTMNLLYL